MTWWYVCPSIRFMLYYPTSLLFIWCKGNMFTGYKFKRYKRISGEKSLPHFVLQPTQLLFVEATKVLMYPTREIPCIQVQTGVSVLFLPFTQMVATSIPILHFPFFTNYIQAVLSESVHKSFFILLNSCIVSIVYGCVIILLSSHLLMDVQVVSVFRYCKQMPQQMTMYTSIYPSHLKFEMICISLLQKIILILKDQQSEEV